MSPNAKETGRGRALPNLRTVLGGGKVLRRGALGILYACVAGAASVGLIGLAGWFIAASALAGVATFIVAYPSSGVRAFAALRVVFRYLERLTNHRVTFSILARLRVYFFERALRIPSERFARYHSGDLLSRATADIDALDNAFPRVVVPTVAAAVVCAGAVFFLAAYTSLLIAAVLGAGCLLAGGVLPLASTFLGRRSGAGIARSRSQLRSEVVETLEGLPEIQSCSAGPLVATRLNVTIDSTLRDERRAHLLDAAGTSAGILTAQLTTLAILTAGLLSGGLTGPVLALAVFVAVGVFEQLGALPAAYRALGLTRAAAGRLEEVFAPKSEEVPAGDLPFPAGDASLSLKGVTFRYEGRERPAVSGVSFEAEPGSLTALVGPSGSGKTTLLKLLAGELRPDSGQARIGGIPARDLSPDALAGHVAYVSQDEHVFDATLRENLALAAPEIAGKPHEDDVLLYVLDAVGLSDFAAGLEAGLDTPVGEHGQALSGGQRRRLAVARALLRKPSVLLLDEPTGSLDDESARLLLRGVRKNLPHTTILLATHDPNLVAQALGETRTVKLG